MSENMEFAAGWRPSEGDVVSGQVVSIDRGWSSQMDSYYPIVTLQPDEGDPVAIHCFHASLRAKLVDLKPEIGETLIVKFQGKRPQKNRPDRTVAVYSVKVEGRSAAQVWDRFEDKAAKTPKSDIPDDDDLPF